MISVIITGYDDRSDGPSIFTKTLSHGLKSHYQVCNIRSKFSTSDLLNLIRSDIVFLSSHNLMPLLIVLITFFLPKKKVISIIHGGGDLLGGGFLLRALIKVNYYILLNFVSDVIFVSKFQMNKFVSSEKQHDKALNYHVIPNCVEPSLHQFNVPLNKQKLIIYAGGESFIKGRCILDEIIEKIGMNSFFEGYKLLAINMKGNESYRVGFLNVELRKKVEHPEFLELLSNSELFLSLSLEETFGIACLESYILKNKVVCFKNCGFLDYVNNSNVQIIRNYTANDFYQGVVLATSNEFMIISDDLEQHTSQKFISRYREVIEG